MKDEIKEILDEIKDYSEHEYLPPCCELTNEECKHLLDYTTNLQESEAYYYGQYKDYKSRNEKAIEYIKSNEFYFDYKTGACIKGVIPLLNILNGGDDND